MGLLSNNSATHKLTDITRGMQHAASTTTAMLAQQYLYMLEQYFDAGADGTYNAKTVSVHLPDNKVVTVPLISLVQPKGLALENMKVALSIKIDSADVKDATHPMDGSQATRSSFKVELSPKGDKGEKRKSDIIDIEMEFKAFDPPEGIMRAIDQFARYITPLDRGSMEEEIKPDKVDSVLASLRSALSNNNVMKLLEKYGYDRKRLQYAIDLCGKVRACEKEYAAVKSEAQQARETAHARYAVTFRIAQMAFQENQDAYPELQLSKIRTETDKLWYSQANNFYRTLLGSDEYSSKMAEFGYEESTLEDELDLVKQFNDIDAKKRELASIPERTELSQWMDQFRGIAKLALQEKSELLDALFPGISILMTLTKGRGRQ